MFNGRRKLVTSVAKVDPLPWKISPFNKSGSPKKRPAASMMLMWLIILAGRCSMYICTYVIWMSYGYVVHKNHVAQNETMIRYSFTIPRSAPSKANTDPKSTLWNLWSFWVFKKRNTTWACTSSLPAHSDLGPPTTFRTSMWDFLVRKTCGIAPEKRSKFADTDAVVPAIVVVVAAIVSWSDFSASCLVLRGEYSGHVMELCAEGEICIPISFYY